MDSYDYVIVGVGTACVLINKFIETQRSTGTS